MSKERITLQTTQLQIYCLKVTHNVFRTNKMLLHSKQTVNYRLPK